MQKITAIDIKTELWNQIIDLLTNQGWRVGYKYNGFDAGIDFDFVILTRQGEEILFGWDNWFEGEIQCSPSRMQYIESLIHQPLKLGEPEHLIPAVIKLFRK